MSFLVHALAGDQFEDLAALGRAELAARGIEVHTATAKPGYPCRVSLRDAEPGDQLYLLNYTHQPASGPYRSCHAIFVGVGARAAEPAPGQVPAMIAGRLLSVRGFDDGGSMVAAEVTPGAEAAAVFEAMLAEPEVRYLQVHTAARGCFLAEVTPWVEA